MPIINLPLIGSGTPSQGIQLNPSELLNLYEVNSNGVSNPASKQAAIRTPGTSLYLTVPNKSIFRGWININNTLYCVFGNSLYTIATNNTISLLGTIASISGRVSMAFNGFQLMIDDGTVGYCYTFATRILSVISGGSFYPSGFITYQNNQIISMQPGTNTVWFSNLNDCTTWNALDFGSMESDPQAGIGVFATPNYLFVFGIYTTEVWTNTGAQFDPFEPIPGVTIPYGCASKYSICYTNQTLIWLSQNRQGQAMLVGLGSGQVLSGFGGFIPQNLLNEADTYTLQQVSYIHDAKAVTFQFNGHIFYAITFPTANVSYIYDTNTRKLIQWASWFAESTNTNGTTNYILGRHLFDDFIEFNGMLLVADYRGGGNILQLSPAVYTDYNSGVDNSIPVRCVLPAIRSEGKRLTINSIEIDYERGTSEFSQANETTNQALNQSLLTMSFSKDGGRTYPYVRQIPFGYSGQYSLRAKANRFGTFRYGALKIEADCPSYLSLYNVWADVEMEDSGQAGGQNG